MFKKSIFTEGRAGRRQALELGAFLAAQVVGFELALLGGLGVAVGHLVSLVGAVGLVAGLRRRDLLPLVAVAPLALFLSGGVLMLLERQIGLEPSWAILPAAVTAAMVLRLDRGRCAWDVGAVAVVAYLFLLRLVFVGQIDLIPQEAYYWNYAQHPSLGYLDHPPMVAWLNLAGTAVFGNTELGVRVGALGCSLVTFAFVALLSRNVIGRSRAAGGVAFVAILPFFFGSGFLMTPDAPLVACWAGSLYFLERILLGNRRWAWWGLGASIGLGMLSKYTIFLVVPALLVFMALDPRARRWLLRPEPYLAGILAVVVFSPVLIWNFQHDWASFRFQGPTRWNEPFEFHLHVLLRSILVLVTPIALWAFGVALVRGRPSASESHDSSQEPRKRAWLFALVFTVVPLSVFVAFSLGHKVKLNWTGPLWLAVIPLASVYLAPAEGPSKEGAWVSTLRRVWMPTVFLLLLGYGGMLYGLTVGVPGVDVAALARRTDWRELGRRIDALERAVVEASGREPLVVGMDKYYIPSELAFYDGDGHGAAHTAGIHLFGDNSLMYGFWFPSEAQRGRTAILVGDDPRDLDSAHVVRRFLDCGPIRTLSEAGDPGPTYFYRVCSGYTPPRGS